MATIYNFLFPHNIISPPSTIKKPVNKTTSFPLSITTPLHYSTISRDFPRTRVSFPVSFPNTIDAEYLETEFSGHGVTFTQISDSCVVRMALKNGSVANILLPSGLITSYKAEMWHGGIVEILHTSVSEGKNDGGAVIRGGVSVAVDFRNDQGLSWSPTAWGFHQVKGSPKDFIQVELISNNIERKVEIKHIVTLRQDCLKSEINIFNHNTSPLTMSGSVLAHLTVSTPEATYAIGLERSDYTNRPPLITDFGIIPPGFGRQKNQASNKFWDTGFFSSSRTRNQDYNNDAEEIAGDSEDDIEGEETDDFKCLTDEMSTIYRNAPRDITILDRGRRNSVIVGGGGFKEVYMFSPGSSHAWYGKYAYICIGLAALLEPIVVKPQGEWRGVHRLHNPNL